MSTLLRQTLVLTAIVLAISFESTNAQTAIERLWAPNFMTGVTESVHQNPAALAATSGAQWDDEGVDAIFAPSNTPTLRFGLEILTFTRGPASDFDFTTDDNGDSFSFADFDFGSEETIRYTIQFMDDFGSGIELTFFDFNEFDTTLVADGPNVVPTFFGGIPSNPVASYDNNYQSRLTNVELNFWQRRSELIRTGIGLRHVNLDENFDVTESNSGGLNLGFFSRTENEMWGAQVMANLRCQRG